jgi:hypothetical protein
VFFTLKQGYIQLGQGQSPQFFFCRRGGEFFFTSAREDSVVEARYSFNPETATLMRYYDTALDYDATTFQSSDICLDRLAECRFSYYDGTAWKDSWDKDSASHPSMVKVVFRFNDETKEREFEVNIPVSP